MINSTGAIYCDIMSESMRHSVRWPKAPNALGTALRRMASNLRAAGIEIQFSRADLRGRRVVSLVCASEPRERPSYCQWPSVVFRHHIGKAELPARFDRVFPWKIWRTSNDSAMVAPLTVTDGLFRGLMLS